MHSINVFELRLQICNSSFNLYFNKNSCFLLTATAYDKNKRKKGQMSDEKRQRLLRDAKNLKQNDCDGLRYQIDLKEGGQYFITTNLDVSDGLFNGATGTLMKIEESEASEDIVRVWMHFEDTNIGSEKRRTFLRRHGKYPNFAVSSWTPIEKLTKTLSKAYYDGVRIIRTQIPLLACNGMTIAKAQGSSLPLVVVSVSGSRLVRSELYVACSRATSLEGLFIDGDFAPPQPPAGVDIVGDEMKRLRATPLLMELKFLQDFNSDYNKIYFHNVESLNHQHFKDITSDRCPMSADFIFLVEPRLLAGDTYQFSGHSEFHRVNCSSNRNSEGILALKKGIHLVSQLYTD